MGEKSGPEGGHVEGMAGWAPYLKTRLVAVYFLDTNHIDS